MPYAVIDINYHPKPIDTNYVFDTNILLPVLGFPLNHQQVALEQRYLAYFNAVYVHLQERSCYKIFIPSVQLSELFNRLLQAEASKYYKESIHGKFNSFYKKTFRTMGECKKAFDIYKADLLVYADVITFLEYTENITLGELLNFDIHKLDINDAVILRLAQNTNAVLVSHDADYDGQEITQATLNTTLIRNVRSRMNR